jgi:predicted dehydrogenase
MRAILEAERRTGRRVDVAFNYRFAPTARAVKQLLRAGAIGDVVSVDFHWYLDVQHGTDYFRRWHAERASSGSLFVHKATHHFDLLNWYLESDPEEVFARGALVHFGRNGAFRGTRCRGCAHAVVCDYHFDIGRKPWLEMLYEAPSKKTAISATPACSARRSTSSTR